MRRDHATRYNTAHRKLRQRLLATYTPGLTPCALCGNPMRDPARLLDLAHADTGRGYSGLSHQACNRGDAARLANRTKAGEDPQPRPRTNW